MIQNSLQTNISESLDLLSLELVAYAFFLGVIPSYFIYKAPIQYGNFKQELYSKLKSIVLSIIIIVLLVLSFSKYYTSFFREHKPL
jgi:lipid A ethanolaminephosphotransferase